MFIAALFLSTKNYKEYKHPSTVTRYTNCGTSFSKDTHIDESQRH